MVEPTEQKQKTSQSISYPRVLEPNDELKLHLYGTELIFEAGLMLQIPQITISIAQRLYHRFYNANNNKKEQYMNYPPFHIAMTCSYIGCKINENQRKHRDILTVYDRIFNKRNNIEVAVGMTLDVYGNRYTKWRNILMKLELKVLAIVGYIDIVGIEYHKYLLEFLDNLDASQNLAQKSWSYLNDLHRLPHILKYDENIICCSCILLASRKLKIKLPDNPNWCKLFGVNKEQLYPIASIILELIELPKKMFVTLPNGLFENKESLDIIPQIIMDMKTIYDKKPTKKKPKTNGIISNNNNNVNSNNNNIIINNIKTFNVNGTNNGNNIHIKKNDENENNKNIPSSPIIMKNPSILVKKKITTPNMVINKDKSKELSIKKDKNKEKDRDKDRERDRDRDRDRNRDKDRDKDRDKRKRHKHRSKDRRDKDKSSVSRSYSRSRERKYKNRDRDRSKERRKKSHKKSHRSRDRDYSRERRRDKKDKKERKRSKKRSNKDDRNEEYSSS